MKIMNFLKAAILALPVVVSFSSYAQEMPADNLIAILNCNLDDGATIEEAIEYGRNQDRDETAPNAIFYRVPEVAGSYHENYDFQVALYYPSFVEMNARRSATPSPAVQRANQRRQNFFTCDSASQVIVRSRTVNQENDGFTGDQTMMNTRFCALNEGATLADAYTFAQGVARNYSRAGDNTLMQMYDLLVGPRDEMPQSTNVMITSVAATAEALAARMDIPRTGTDVTEGLTSPFTRCNYPGLWTTYRVFAQQAPQ